MNTSNSRTLEYLDPVSPNTDKKLYVPAVGELKDKRIGFVTNGWASYNAMGAKIEQVFRDKHGMREMRTYKIPTSCAPPEGLLEQVATECDAAIVGMANWGSCTSWSVHDTAQLVKRGMPAVVVATEQFEKLAKVIMRSQNVPESICVLVEGNPEFISAEKLEGVCEQVVDEVLARLTRAHVKWAS